jgi:hypothetical protein
VAAADDAELALRAVAERTGLFDLGPAVGPGWHLLAEATDPAWTAARIDQIAAGDGHGPRPRAVAGAYVGGALAWTVLQPFTAVLVTEHRALDLAPEHLAVLLDDTGWTSRLRVVEPRFAALADDPDAGAAVAVLADDAALLEWAAGRVVATFSPVFGAVRASSPYGLSGLWGALADTLSAVLWLLRDGGAGPEELARAWATTEGLVDAVQRRVPRLKARSRPFRFETPVPPVTLPLRGTCCLYYRTPEAEADATDGLCTTCPRRTDPERVRLVERGFAPEGAA